MRLTWICALLLCVAAVAPVRTAAASGRADASIRKLLERYRTAWLANDPEAVRSCFTPDAVLMPHHGLEPVVGMKAINDFWFPASSAKTTVLKFDRTIDEIGVEGSLAYARGQSEVAWRVEDQGKREDWRTAGTYVAILKKQAGGGWLIARLIWDDGTNERK